MAEINSDLPQVETQGGVGGVSPNLEAVTSLGRGMESAGEKISEGGTLLYRKSAQEETANVYADMAAAREKYTDNLNNALQTGDLDTDQFAQQLKEDTDKIGSNLSTRDSQNFFERQQARLTGAMLLKASHVSGQIAFNNSIDNLTQGTNSMANIARKDPSQFPDLIDQSEEMLNTSVENKQLPAGMEERYRKQFHAQIAYGAGLGLAEMDPGKNPDGTPKENMLTGTLKRLDPSDTADSSNLNRYLSPQQIEGLQSHARQMDLARSAQEGQVLANQEKLLRAKGQVYLDQNSAAIMNGQMDPQNIIKNPNLTLEQKHMAVSMIQAYAKNEVKSDPSYVNDVENQIIHGDISSRDELVKAYDSGKMSGDDFWKLSRKIDETPDGKIVQGNRKLIYQMADQSLRFKGVGGAYTEAGDTANYNFRQELDAKAQQFVQQGKGSLRDFYSNHNPKDPDSPINILNKYRLSPMDKARTGAQEAIDQANGQASKGIQYSTSPTKDIPQPAQAPVNKDMIQPGESISAWKKRTNK